MEGLEDSSWDVLVQLVFHWWNPGAPKMCHGLSYKINISATQTSYSQVNRPASVGSPEPVDANLGPHTHYEAGSGMELESGHHPVDLSDLLQRLFGSKL